MISRDEAFDAAGLALLIEGDKRTWDKFVNVFSPVVFATVRRVIVRSGGSEDDVADAFQDVFERLCRHDYRLLRTFDPERASLATWLRVISQSAAIDARRKRRAPTFSLDDENTPEPSIEPEPVERLVIPENLLTARQILVMRLLYERDLEVADVAAMLNINAQTVRSTKHKALDRLRAYFRDVDGI